MPACKHINHFQQAKWQFRKEKEWVLEFLEPLGAWPAPSDLRNSYDSQGETNSIIKVKVKPERHFCMRTDDDISLHPGIISRSPQNCNLKSHPWGGSTIRDIFPIGTPDGCHSGLPRAVQVWIQVFTQIDYIYMLLLLSMVSISFLLMIVY